MSEQNRPNQKVNEQEGLLEFIQNDQLLKLKLNRLDDHKWRGYGLSYSVEEDSLIEVVTKLKEDPSSFLDMLVDITCVDWLDSRPERFEMVYNFLSLKYGTRLCLKVKLKEDCPEVPSLVPLWNAANFLEREVFDMYGIKFKGHPDLRRILMYDEFVGYPLRKDYPLKGKQPRVELRVPELHNTSEDLHREALVSMPKRKYPTVQEKLEREKSEREGV